MRILVALIAVTILLPMSAQGARKSVLPPKKSQSKMEASLLRRCNDGVALSCYDYGKTLLLSRKKTDKRKGEFYIRRACTLAYAPACQRRSASVEAKVVKDQKARVDAQGNPCNTLTLAKSAKLSDDGKQVVEVSKGSLWEQSGVQAGDTIVSVNGEPYKSAEQIAETMDTGGAVINVLRNGRETSLMVSCP